MSYQVNGWVLLATVILGAVHLSQHHRPAVAVAAPTAKLSAGLTTSAAFTVKHVGVVAGDSPDIEKGIYVVTFKKDGKKYVGVEE
jgi:hypothetical protein